MNPDDGTVFTHVTNREIYDAVMALKEVVGPLATNQVDLKRRVRGLELKFYGILAGMIAAVGGVLAALVTGGPR